MRIGFSSYSLDGEIRAGRMTLRDVIEWSARQGAECMELVPFAFRFDDPDTGKIDDAAIAAVRRQAADAGIPLVNYSVLADFCREGETLEKEIARVKHEIDIAAALGVPRMRHDVAGFRRPQNSNTPADFDRWLPVMAEAARETARYGKALGVTVLIENHGFFANGCDRVERILRAVGDDNYGLLLDTGNIVCVDEDAAVAADTLAPLTRMVHLKDFVRINEGYGLKSVGAGTGEMDYSVIMKYLKKEKPFIYATLENTTPKNAASCRQAMQDAYDNA